MSGPGLYDLEKIPLGEFSLQIAQTADQRMAVLALLKRAYVSRQLYAGDQASLRVMTQQLFDSSIVIAAYKKCRLVGTISVIGDSPAGLPLDKLFPFEHSLLRRAGHRLAEMSSFAVAPDCRESGVSALLMFGGLWIARHLLKANRLVMGVKPETQDVYRQMYQFQEMSQSKTQLMYAPVVGLVHDATSFEEFVGRRCLAPLQNGRLPIAELCGITPPTFLRLPESWSTEGFKVTRLPRADFRTLIRNCYKTVGPLDALTARFVRTQRSDDTLTGLTMPIATVTG